MNPRQRFYLIGIIALSAIGIIATFAAGNEPLLGLDLQGGVEVRYRATTPATPESLDQSVEIIRGRVDGLGVAEPEISRLDNGVLVQLPGVKDADRALELVGTTAKLQFRPVLQELNPGGTTLESLGIDDPVGFYDETFGEDRVVPETTVATTIAGDAETSTTLPVLPTTTTTILETDEEKIAFIEEQFGIGVGGDELTPLEEADDPDAEVVLGEFTDDGTEVRRYRLGPVSVSGEGLVGADAIFQGTEWLVAPEFKSGAEGIDPFNEMAALCFSGAPECPAQFGRANGSMAITLDGRVISAPTVNVPNFARDQITISGAPFSEEEAKELGISLRYGSLPVELEPEQQRVVSGSLGDDALEAGVIAGLVGLAIVALYIMWAYRMLGVVAILSLIISFALLWTIIAWLGSSQGLALTLAGITGLIVSIGVSVDSNIVYFEHLKEDLRNGRTIGSAVDRSFPIAFSTIVKADVASLIAAVLLYLLTTGAVRGFAFYLGLATVLDLVATYFFMGPAVKFLASREGLSSNHALFGVGSTSVPVAAGGEA